MPFTLSIDDDRHLIKVKYAGIITDGECLEVEKRLRSTPEFGAGYQLLHDLSTITDFCVTGKGLYTLATRTEDITNPTAIVVRPGFIYRMAITYEGMANLTVPRVHVFTSEGEALVWLSGFAPLKSPW